MSINGAELQKTIAIVKDPDGNRASVGIDMIGPVRTVDVDTSGLWCGTADQARELAAVLIVAADVVEGGEG